MAKPDELFHGGHYKIGAVTRTGMFEGLFTSPSERVARSHGPVITKFEISPDRVATSRDLRARQKAARAAVRAEPRYRHLRPRAMSELLEEVLSDGSSSHAVSYEGNGEAYESWECQRLRGVVARALGFQAVACGKNDSGRPKSLSD